MNRLRLWFAMPGGTALILLFCAPLGIIAAYSVLSRGPYGGVMLPWTAETYSRVFDPLYLGILWRSIWVAGLSTALCVFL